MDQEQQQKRYVVIDPVDGGCDFYAIAHRDSAIMPNFPTVSISRHCPNARQEAYDLAERLNKVNGWARPPAGRPEPKAGFYCRQFRGL